ncbi:hypothetical protein KKF84_07780 [Myxococcota bacterium]|nr:hypothetical protein [Myxococcota bacterium]MBU1535205.1 hypothetical protein [Myxococcota bacterium]
MINIIFALAVLLVFVPVASYFTRHFSAGERSVLMRVLFLGLVLRVGLVFLFSVTMPDPRPLSPDASSYARRGKDLAAFVDKSLIMSRNLR